MNDYLQSVSRRDTNQYTVHAAFTPQRIKDFTPTLPAMAHAQSDSTPSECTPYLAHPSPSERLSSAEQLLLGITALLGMEVTVHEVARVADIAPYEVAMTFARSVTLGFMSEYRGGRFTFVHHQIRETFLSSLAPAERLAAHARAATLLSGSTVDRIQQRVHHAFSAAQRSTEDAAIAVQIAREAATLLQAADDFEQAATLLSRAIELHDAAALSGPFAALVVEHAEAVLACGHLAEARPLFHRAAQLAETEQDMSILARAALGLGGVWVREHRLSEEAERVHALQCRALSQLPADAHVLRTRLAVRLAAESVYRGAAVTTVVESVEAARQTEDPHALAEALSLYHHALLTPEHSKLRLTVAQELLSVASVANNRLLALMGLCWKTADLFLLGDTSASMALTELHLRANTLGCQSVLFIIHAMEVMLAIRNGHFEQAEQAAAACYSLGTEVGDADALAYYGAHLAAIRVFQGRETELADLAASVATSPVLTERDRAFATAAALFALRRGESHHARAVLEDIKQNGIAGIVPTSSWLLTLHAICEICAELQESEIAQATYDALLPYAELPIMASLAVVCFGSVHRSLALAAFTCGKRDLAITHLESAVAANERLGHRPASVQARAELALALLQRARCEDEQRGTSLLHDAIAEAETLAMTGLVVRWREALATLTTFECERESHAVTVSSAPQGGWRVAVGNDVATVPDLVGMRYLARLIAAPNQDIPAVALVVDHHATVVPSCRQEVMDKTTLNAVRQRIAELRQQATLTEDAQDELDTLTHELVSASGLGNRIRSFTDVPERARNAVRKAVKRAIEQVAAANPVVGHHLAAHIETGSVCRYRTE